MKRRKFLITGASGSLAAASSALGAGAQVAPVHPTPTEIEGPFYPMIARKDKDFDLTQIERKQKGLCRTDYSDVFPGTGAERKGSFAQAKKR